MPRLKTSTHAAPKEAQPETAVSSAAARRDYAPDLVQIGRGAIALRVEIHRKKVSRLRPLVIVNSVDFPMAPSEAFQERMWNAGYQVIFIERPGFGSSFGLPKELTTDRNIKNGAAVTTEAAVLYQLLDQLELKDIVLLGMGSANPVCYRLARMHKEIELSIFSNAMFNQNIWEVFRPRWFQSMLRQTVGSKPGLYFATYGVKYQLRRAPLTFYRQLLQKSPGDLSYFEANKPDFVKGSRLMRDIEAATYNYDLKMSLTEDPLLHDEFFAGTNAVVFSGEETTELWQSQLEAESQRLGLPVVYAPSGDLYAPYASPEFLLKTIDDHSKLRKRAP